MKPLIGAAVFGLVPIPPMPNTHILSDKDDPPATDGNERIQFDASERLATKEELARLRRELGVTIKQPDGRR